MYKREYRVIYTPEFQCDLRKKAFLLREIFDNAYHRQAAIRPSLLKNQPSSKVCVWKTLCVASKSFDAVVLVTQDVSEFLLCIR